MSPALMIALLGAGLNAATIGHSSHNDATNTIPLPAGSLAGDLCVIYRYVSSSITGGSGTAWPTATTLGGGDMILAARLLEAGDITTPLTLSINAPVVVAVFRGATSVSAARTTGSSTAASFTLAGFTKVPNCVGLITIGYCFSAVESVDLPASVTTDFTEATHPGSVSIVLGGSVRPFRYVDGSGIDISGAGGTTATKYGAVCELLG